MNLVSMKCPRCGLIQMRAAECKACGQVAAGVSAARGSPGDKVEIDPAAALSRAFFFHGDGRTLFGIHAVNAFFTILTLGIYSFWAKVKVRRYLSSQSEFEGDRFAYHGTGSELFFGWLKAALLFLCFSALFTATFMGLLEEPFEEVRRHGPLVLVAGGRWLEIVAKTALLVAIYGLFLAFFISLATVGAHAYRLSRTSWRGIRFSFRGRAGEFFKLFLRGLSLSVVTLGLYYPLFQTRRHAYLVSRSYLGNEPFRFDGDGRDLFRSFVKAILLALPTLGFYWYEYQAEKQRYYWGHTCFSAARFRCTIDVWNLMRLHGGNMLLLLATLGLAFAWVRVRNARFLASHLTLVGPIDFVAIEQRGGAASATGEGIAGILDMDVGIA
jgi:uncharacterized membrane protein YjgN (DUF898 family)